MQQDNIVENSFVFCFLCWGRIKQYESSLCFVVWIFPSILCRPLCFFASGAFQGLKQEVLENSLSLWLLWNIPGVTNSNPNRIKQSPKWAKQTSLIFFSTYAQFGCIFIMFIFAWTVFTFRVYFPPFLQKYLQFGSIFLLFFWWCQRKIEPTLLNRKGKKLKFKIITLMFKTFAIGESLWTKFC